VSETTVTFAEVLAAARLGRARVAPEMAGYLALGVADALFKQPHAVDERSCWLTDEGAILAAPSGATITGPADVSASVRRLLGALLEVARGGGAAATLAVVARKPPSADMGALVAEIEAALIPVNRGAARRALARLARETARARDEGSLVLEPPKSEPPAEPAEDTEPIRVSAPDAEAAAEPVREAEREPTPTPPTAVSEPAPPSTTPPPPDAASKPLTRADELLARFSGSVVQSDQEIARELKAMVGLEPTPPPPDVVEERDEPAAAEPTEAPAEDLSEAPPSVEMPLELAPPRRSKAGLFVLLGIVVLGVGALAVFLYYPELFSGN